MSKVRSNNSRRSPGANDGGRIGSSSGLVYTNKKVVVVTDKVSDCERSELSKILRLAVNIQLRSGDPSVFGFLKRLDIAFSRFSGKLVHYSNDNFELVNTVEEQYKTLVTLKKIFGTKDAITDNMPPYARVVQQNISALLECGINGRTNKEIHQLKLSEEHSNSIMRYKQACEDMKQEKKTKQVQDKIQEVSHEIDVGDIDISAFGYDENSISPRELKNLCNKLLNFKRYYSTENYKKNIEICNKYKGLLDLETYNNVEVTDKELKYVFLGEEISSEHSEYINIAVKFISMVRDEAYKINLDKGETLNKAYVHPFADFSEFEMSLNRILKCRESIEKCFGIKVESVYELYDEIKDRLALSFTHIRNEINGGWHDTEITYIRDLFLKAIKDLGYGKLMKNSYLALEKLRGNDLIIGLVRELSIVYSGRLDRSDKNRDVYQDITKYIALNSGNKLCDTGSIDNKLNKDQEVDIKFGKFKVIKLSRDINMIQMEDTNGKKSIHRLDAVLKAIQKRDIEVKGLIYTNLGVMTEAEAEVIGGRLKTILQDMCSKKWVNGSANFDHIVRWVQKLNIYSIGNKELLQLDTSKYRIPYGLFIQLDENMNIRALVKVDKSDDVKFLCEYDKKSGHIKYSYKVYNVYVNNREFKEVISFPSKGINWVEADRITAMAS